MYGKFALMGDPSIRLFVTTALHAGGEVTADEAQSHYLANVMRRSAGEPVKLFNGQDGEWLARILSVSRKAVRFGLVELVRPQVIDPDCWLCFALLKRQKTELVVEKATELGASVIQPIITERTQGSTVNIERLRAIAIEAAEQCERLAVPEIKEPVRLAALLAAWPGSRRLFVADERRTGAVLRPSVEAQPIALMTGPEGGFTDAELDGIGTHPRVNLHSRISLGPRILRAETAAIAGLALLLAGPA